jgi:micrococcal nuclease
VLGVPGPALLAVGALTLVRTLLLSGLWLTLAVGLDAQNLYAVQRVVDGDTVVLTELGPVRLIGVDTPETKDPRKPVQYYGIEASAFLQSMLSGQSVRVEYDHQRRDKYQRTLAYLYLSDGTFVNREIIRQGFGHAYLTYPFAYAEDFRAAEREAREAERGLWGQAPAKAAQAAPVEPSRVWVNTSSRVYHCPGTRYYGNTARGEYLT